MQRWVISKNVKVLLGNQFFEVMMFIWSEESIKWYYRAAAASTFFSDIAEEMKQYTNRDESVCDLGCGLGNLSIEMAKHAKKITAVDIESKALDVLKNDMVRKRIENIDILHSDWKVLSGQTWDTVAACNFGNVPEEIPFFMDLCTKRCILILRVNNSSNIRRLSISSVRHYLEEKGYCYTFHQRQMEFGQHFISEEEAERFFTHYGQMPETGKNKYLKENLIPTDTKEYPFYHPCQSTTSIFVIQKSRAGAVSADVS